MSQLITIHIGENNEFQIEFFWDDFNKDLEVETITLTYDRDRDDYVLMDRVYLTNPKFRDWIDSECWDYVNSIPKKEEQEWERDSA